MTKPTRTEALGADRSSIALFFDSMSATRNELFRTHPVLDYEQRIRSRAVLDRVATQPGDRILDIGCGNARDMLPMLRDGARITGVDLSEGMIRQAKAELAAAGYPEVRLEVGDATHLEFADGIFDKIVCSEVIEHVPEADDAVREMGRVLKPGGRLVISTPNRRSWYGFDRYILWSRILRRRWNHPFDKWRTLDEVSELLEANGFTIDQQETVCYVPGFALTYFLPRALQAVLVALIRYADPLAARLAKRRGYLLVVTAVKR